MILPQGWTLATPEWLLLLLLVPFATWLRQRRSPAEAGIASVQPTVPATLWPLSLTLVLIGLLFLSLALAGPQKIDNRRIAQRPDAAQTARNVSSGSQEGGVSRDTQSLGTRPS